MKKPKAESGNTIKSEEEEIPTELKQKMREILRRVRTTMEMQNSAVNPHNKRMTVRELCLSMFFPRSVGETMDAAEVGNYFIKRLRDLSAEQCEKDFATIIRMKKESEKGKHRNRHALEAYKKYTLEFNKFPSKSQLKSYMIARKNEFTDQPEEGDGKGWTRLWKSSSSLDQMNLR